MFGRFRCYVVHFLAHHESGALALVRSESSSSILVESLRVGFVRGTRQGEWAEQTLGVLDPAGLEATALCELAARRH